jgi:SAM-dependent methyltransferase
MVFGFRGFAKQSGVIFAIGLVLTGAPIDLVRGQTSTVKTVPEIGRPGKDVMWVPSPDPLVDKMLEIAQVSAVDVVMDLGSGDGRTVIAAAQLGARAIGVEYDPALVELSRVNATQAGVANLATFVAADLFEVDLSPATVITMFLLPELNSKLRPRLLALAPGTRIVSNTWDLEDWEADETAVLDPCPGFCTALLWIVPARIEGIWELSTGSLTLMQRFQTVTGVLREGSDSVEILGGRLRGKELSFHVGGMNYKGVVAGDVIGGLAEAGASSFNWRATRAH